MKRFLAIAAFVTVAAALALLPSAALRAVTITNLTPNQAGPTQESVNWSTAPISTINDTVRYGAVPASFSINGAILPSGSSLDIVDMVFANSQVGYLLANPVAGSSSVLYETTDGGQSWLAETTFLTAAKAMAYDSSSGNVYVGVASDYIYIWSPQSLYSCGLGGISDIYDMDIVGSNLWVVGNSRTIIKFNLGNCAASVSMTPAGLDPAVTAFTDIDAYDTANVWAVANSDIISVSTDGGATWTTTDQGTNALVEDVQAVAADEAFAAGRSGWVYHYQAGTGWTKDQPGGGYDFISLAAVAPKAVFAFGWGLNSKDFVSITRDGTNWSGVQQLSTSTLATVAEASRPLNGILAGDAKAYGRFSLNYASSTAASAGQSHAASIGGLQQGVSYHAGAESYDSAAKSYAESGEFLFTTQSLGISSGPSVTPQATSAAVSWGTTLPAASNRVHASKGLAWKKTNVSSATFNDINADGDTAYLSGAGAVNSILKSGDLGQTWLTAWSASNVTSGVSIKGNRGWAVGYRFIQRTSDGATWTPQYGGTDIFSGVSAVDDLHAWVSGVDLTLNAGSGQGIIAQTSNGTAWQRTFVVPGALPTYLNDIWAVDINTIMAVGDRNSVYRSTDGGVSWSAVVATTAPVSNFRRIIMTDPLNGWIVGSNGVIVRTSDGGKTWAQAFSGCISNTTSLNGVAAGSANDVWIVGGQGTIKHWTGGSTCASLDNVPPGHGITNTSNLYGVDVDGKNVWIVGDSGLVARYGIDTTAGNYFTASNAAPNVNLIGLASNSTYDYFVQSDSNGFTTTASGSFTTLAQPTLEVTPTTLSFTAVQNQAVPPASQTVTVRDKNAPATDIGAWTAANLNGDAWLSFAPAGGASTPGTITVSPNIAGLAVGNYTGTIRVNATGPGVVNPQQDVTVNLAITARPKLVLSATTVSFTATEEAPTNPSPVAVDVTNGTASSTLTYTVTKLGISPWLTAASNGGPSPYFTPSKITFSPDITGLTAGTYAETVRVDGGPNADNSPQDITVTLIVEPAPQLELTPGPNPTLSFTATQAGADPASQAVSIRNSGGGNMTWTAAKSATWFDIDVSSGGNGPTAMTISPHTGALAPGTYNGTVTVNAGTVGTQTITLQFTVVAAPVFSVSWTEKPGALVFTTPQGTNPADRTVIVQSGGAAWSASVVAGNAWLSLPGTTTGSTYPDNVAVHAEVVAPPLGTGIYNGTLRFTSAGAIPAQIDVAVTLNVTAPPVLSVNPTVLNFTATAGSTNPTPQTFQITNSGVGVLNWTIDQPAASWIRVSTTPCSGTYNATISGGAPSTVNACIDVNAPVILDPGSYTANVTVNAPAALQSPKTVTVNLNVQPDTAPPTFVAGSYQVTTGFDCNFNSVFATVQWQTNELADSQVYYTDVTNAGVPDFNIYPAILNDPVDTVLHTGGTLNHNVTIDNLTGGHRYYLKFRSTDRYGNTMPFEEHDQNNPALLLSFVAPANCDSTPPTNVVLTVPPDPLFGIATLNMSALDESSIDNFKLYADGSAVPLTTVGSPLPAGACALVGNAYACLVTYALNTTLLIDGPHTLVLQACDVAGNCASSAPVNVNVNNAAPVVSNVRAENVININGQWQATIKWDTDIAADALVDYGLEDQSHNFSYTNRQTGDDPVCTNGLNHCVTLTNLEGDQIYHYQVKSCSLQNPQQCDN